MKSMMSFNPSKYCESCALKNVVDCVKNDHLLCVQYLYENCYSSIHPETWQKALRKSVLLMKDGIFEYLSRYIPLEKLKYIDLYTAIDYGNSVLVEQYLDEVQPHSTLGRALLVGKLNLLKLLIEKTNHIYTVSSTIFERASCYGHDDCIIYLLEHPNRLSRIEKIRGMDGRTIQLLIKHGYSQYIYKDEVVDDWINERKNIINTHLDIYMIKPLINIVLSYHGLI